MDLRPNLVSIWERKRWRRKGEEKERRRRRGREREEKRRGKGDQRYGTTKLEYGSLVCMIIILPKPRVLLGFHLNPKIMESKVGNTLNSIIRIWNPSFEDGFML